MKDQELITKLLELKSIRPRKNWVVFAKSQILTNSFEFNYGAKHEFYKNLLLSIRNPFLQKRLAYAFAVMMVAFIGLFGATSYLSVSNDNVSEQSSVSLMAGNEIKSEVEDFKIKSQSLAQAVSAKSEDMSIVLQEVKDAAKSLTETIQKDPDLVKVIALEVNNNKAYLDISGEDGLKESSDALYKAIDNQMIEDLEKTTLTLAQQESLNRIKKLYEEERYSYALESILLLNKSMEKN